MTSLIPALTESDPLANVEESLRRIHARNDELNAFSVIRDDEARAEAAQVVAGPLRGVPIAVKEELDLAGHVTNFGGRANSTPAASDGEVVRRLREAGAVIVGKTQMPEFGCWPYTESDAYGPTRNPWDTSRSPGGSSGGTAVAVATGMVPVAMGGDGGGSIRIPAACTGIFGLKPQRGRVSTSPMPHLWWALGTVGPLSRTVADSAIVYDVIAGNLPTDMFRAGPTGSFAEAARREPGRLRIGWSAKPVTLGVKPDPINVAALQDTVRLLQDLGHDVREVDPHYPDPTAAFVPQFLGGVRAEADEVDHFDRLERRTRETYRIGSWVRRPVIDFALRRTEGVSRKANRIFDECDVLLTPTMANRPPQHGLLSGLGTLRSALKAVPAIAYCALWNVAGNPAASVPGAIGPDGLPTACQVVGPTDGEEILLSLAAQMERARPFPVLP